MNRRDFWKWLVGMAAAPAALLAAGKAKPEPRKKPAQKAWPRYFRPLIGRTPSDPAIYFVWEPPGYVNAIGRDGRCLIYPREWREALGWRWPRRLHECIFQVRDHVLCEITAAEAEALLKAYRTPARRVGKHYDGLLYDDLYISNPTLCNAENTRKARAAYEKIFGHGVSP